MNQFARPGLAVTELPSFNESDNGKILKINGESGKLGWEQQGGLLPQVTSADNGKVLAVKDGAWAADSNLFVVTVTNNSSDKSKTEIVDAVNAGKVVVARKNGSTYAFNYYDTTNAYFSKTNSSGSANILRINQNKVATEFYKKMAPDFGVSDVGKTLKLKDDSGSAIMSWEPTKFTVTLTPTALDYSGTMDKTPAEITAAYGAGQEIVFDIPSMSARIHATQFLVVNDVIIAGGMVFYDVNNSPVIITIATDSSASTYATHVFATTPAS